MLATLGAAADSVNCVPAWTPMNDRLGLLLLTATIADRPRFQPPGPASSCGSGACAWPQAEACS